MANVKLPQSLVTIGNEAFAHCYELYSMELPEGLISIGNRAFAACGACVTYGLDYSGANHFTSVILPSTLKYIGEQAFYMCQSLKSIIIPDKVEKISKYAFNGCYYMTTVVLPAGVTIQQD